jgi:hypothetical protein
MRPLHRLGIYTQHTMRHLGSCPIIAVVGGSVRKAGRARTTAIELGHIVRGASWLSPTFGAVLGRTSSSRVASSICRLAPPCSQETRAAARLSRQCYDCIRLEGLETSAPRQSVWDANQSPPETPPRGLRFKQRSGRPSRCDHGAAWKSDPFHRRACGGRVCVQGRARLPQPSLFGIEWDA